MAIATIKQTIARADIAGVPRALYALVGLSIVGGALAALVVGLRHTSDAHAGIPTARVTERDFRVSAPRTLHAGVVKLSIANHGPDTHELIVVRSSAADLPLRHDGLTVDEDRLDPETAASIDGKPPGHTTHLTVRLRPGRYVFFCNMEGHYMGGMHAQVVVH